MSSVSTSQLVVQKFGGTSLASAERIRAVAQICSQTKHREACDLVVVVSAMGHTTDELVKLMGQVNTNPSSREQDMLLSSGEQVSIALLAMALQAQGQPAISLTGWQAGIQTEPLHGSARILEIQTESIRRHLNEGKIVVVAGFQGLAEGQITTLGRGGSDTTAVALAAALKADRCDIYTDVNSVYTADPRLVAQASPLPAVTYDEMLELAKLGAQVLNPRSVETAKNHQVPLRVRSSWEVDNPGTLICESLNPKAGNEPMLEGAPPVRGVALDRQQARLAILGVPDQPGIASKLFCRLAEQQISVDLIVQCTSHDQLTEVDLTVRREDAKAAQQALQNIAKEIGAQEVSLDSTVVKVSIVGAGMIDQPGIAATMFRTLGENGINIQIITTSEIHISCIIAEEAAERAIQLIHAAFHLDQIAA